MNIPENLMYSETHEYLETLPDGHVRIGITDFAQKQLGDLVFVNLPQEGDAVAAGEAFGDLESVKAVSDVISPATGTVCAINEALLDEPQLINQNAYGAWMIEVENAQPEKGLMDAAAYQAFCEKER